MSSPKQVIDRINDYRRKFPSSMNRDWYVGIAADPRQRLFNDHDVSRDVDPWIYEPADSSSEARQIERAYHDAGYDGDSGGGDNTTRYVYAYLKSRRTNP